MVFGNWALERFSLHRCGRNTKQNSKFTTGFTQELHRNHAVGRDAAVGDCGAIVEWLAVEHEEHLALHDVLARRDALLDDVYGGVRLHTLPAAPAVWEDDVDEEVVWVDRCGGLLVGGRRPQRVQEQLLDGLPRWALGNVRLRRLLDVHLEAGSNACHHQGLRSHELACGLGASLPTRHDGGEVAPVDLDRRRRRWCGRDPFRLQGTLHCGIDQRLQVADGDVRRHRRRGRTRVVAGLERRDLGRHIWKQPQ